MSSERFVTRLAVFVILHNEHGEILLQQRAGTGYLDGYWDLPSGHVEYGEALLDTAAREVMEEVGVHVVAKDLRLVHIDQYFLDRDYVNFIFAANSKKGKPKICEPEKCSAIGWFAPDALPEQCVNVVRAVERAGFRDELTYSLTDRDGYRVIMGEPFTKSA